MKKQAIAVNLPSQLSPAMRVLVAQFAEAMGEKLLKAQIKHGFDDDWMRSDWEEKCQDDLRIHAAKGDPLDVANYCAFLWHHSWSTNPLSKLKLSKADIGKMRMIETHGGMEVESGRQRNYHNLAGMGLVEFGRARGPSNRFKRVTLTDKGVAYLSYRDATA